jgi:hypothetical protein
VKHSDHIVALNRVEKAAVTALRSISAHGDLLKAALAVLMRHGLMDEFITEHAHCHETRPIPATAERTDKGNE